MPKWIITAQHLYLTGHLKFLRESRSHFKKPIRGIASLCLLQPPERDICKRSRLCMKGACLHRAMCPFDVWAKQPFLRLCIGADGVRRTLLFVECNKPRVIAKCCMFSPVPSQFRVLLYWLSMTEYLLEDLLEVSDVREWRKSTIIPHYFNFSACFHLLLPPPLHSLVLISFPVWIVPTRLAALRRRQTGRQAEGPEH